MVSVRSQVVRPLRNGFGGERACCWSAISRLIFRTFSPLRFNQNDTLFGDVTCGQLILITFWWISVGESFWKIKKMNDDTDLFFRATSVSVLRVYWYLTDEILQCTSSNTRNTSNYSILLGISCQCDTLFRWQWLCTLFMGQSTNVRT